MSQGRSPGWDNLQGEDEPFMGVVGVGCPTIPREATG